MNVFFFPSLLSPVNLTYDVFDGKGESTPLVFLHGLFGSKSNFHSIAKSLVQRTGRKVMQWWRQQTCQFLHQKHSHLCVHFKHPVNSLHTKAGVGTYSWQCVVCNLIQLPSSLCCCEIALTDNLSCVSLMKLVFTTHSLFVLGPRQTQLT